MNEKRIRFGIIGLGVQGQLYTTLLTGHQLDPAQSSPVPPCPENACLTALSTRSAESIARYRAAFPDIPVFADWRELILSGLCDAVIITVPHYQHPEITLFAMEHGVSVLCEKPAAVRASDAEQMNACAAAHPELGYGLVMNQRTNPLFRALHDLICSGELGEVRRSNWLLDTWWRPESYYHSSPWRATWSGEGGGLLINQAQHQLDLWMWLCGQPSQVYALCVEGAHRNITVENDVTLVTRYPNGATGSFLSCTHNLVGINRLEITLARGSIVVENGSRAVIRRYTRPESYFNDTLTRQDHGRLMKEAREQLFTEEVLTHSTAYGEQYIEIFRNYAAHLLNGEPLIAPGAEGLASVQLANTAILSGWEDRPLAFPCDSAAFNAALEARIQAEKG